MLAAQGAHKEILTIFHGPQVAPETLAELRRAMGDGAEPEIPIECGGHGWSVFWLRLHGEVRGLAPGSVHGFHVHETGDCSAPDATSAGGHFNPGQQPHGDRAAGGAHHAGDIPNQTAGDNGEAAVDQTLAGLEIASGGANDIVGKGVIVHAQADDYTTQPTGNAGGRIACGVIELVNAPPADTGPAE